MPKSRIILCLGFFLALLPVLGFPNSWDHFFDTALGLLIVLLSVLISVDRRLMLKAKAEKRTQRKRAVATPPPAEEEPVISISEPEPEPRLEPIPELEPVFSMPEIAAEPAPRPVFEPAPQIETGGSFSAASEPGAHRPKRKRRVKVFDADASVPAETAAPAAPETFDTSSTEF